MPERTYLRITHLNVDNHKRAAITHPRIEAVVEWRENHDSEWEEKITLDISGAIADTKLETAPGQIVKLWLGVVAFDVMNETQEKTD